MIVFDPLYSRFLIPDDIEPLVLTPEVRRLSQVRFLNTITPSLATLGDLRRYSHTLGVLYLAGLLRVPEYGIDEIRALKASVLLHDIGTPPFGHLFEYHLKEHSGWSHEGIIENVLFGTYAPENRAHQIFAGRILEFRAALKSCGISIDLVGRIVSGNHPLSALLFGTIDLDNLDNVARMAWALGLKSNADIAVKIASNLGVSRSGELRLTENERSLIREWAMLRRKIYDILVFDPPTVAAQAILSDAIGTAIVDGVLSADDWYLSDEQLLERLRSNPRTKEVVACEYLGRLPRMVFAVQLRGSLADLNLGNRTRAKEIVEGILRESIEGSDALSYSFVDRGTFEKKLTFRDPHGDSCWSEGNTSNSLILYGFVRSTKRPSVIRAKRVVERLLEELQCGYGAVIRCDLSCAETADDQRSFNFSVD